MDIQFPVELQKYFENALLQDSGLQGNIFTLLELADRLHANPLNLQKVLSTAVRKGLVARHGEDYAMLGISPEGLDSLFQHTSRAGLKPSSDVRAAIIQPAGQDAAARLDVQVGAPLYRLERTRIVNDEVLANQVNFIPYEICPGLGNDDISRYSFQKLLEERYHTIITEIKEDQAISPASQTDLNILGLPPGSPVLVIDRLSLSRNRMPLVWASIHIRTDRYHYVSKLWPQAAALLEEYHLDH